MSGHSPQVAKFDDLAARTVSYSSDMPFASFPVPRSSVEAAFTSAFSEAESIRRLKWASKESIFEATRREAAVGKVTASRVVLQRVKPLVGNSFKPFFFGAFQTVNGMVTLRGRFAIHWFPRIFATVWLGACVVIGVVILQSNGVWALAPAGMFLLGLGFMCFLRWLAEDDVEWLSSVIRRALQGANSTDSE